MRHPYTTGIYNSNYNKSWVIVIVQFKLGLSYGAGKYHAHKGYTQHGLKHVEAECEGNLKAKSTISEVYREHIIAGVNLLFSTLLKFRAKITKLHPMYQNPVHV